MASSILQLLVGLSTTSCVLLASAAVSSDGTCGGSQGNTCQGSNYGNSCGRYNLCGRDPSYSKLSSGCQPAYGFCYQPGSVSPDGTCGTAPDSFTCQGSNFGNSCGPNDRCGSDSGYSGPGCKAAYGFCAVCTVTAIPSTVTSRTTTTTITGVTSSTTLPSTVTSGVTTTTTTTTSTSVIPSCTGRVTDKIRSAGPCGGSITGYDNPINDGQPIQYPAGKSGSDNADDCRMRCDADLRCNGYVLQYNLNQGNPPATCYTRSSPDPIPSFCSNLPCDAACRYDGGSSTGIYYGNRHPACVAGTNYTPPAKKMLVKKEAMPAPVPVTSAGPNQQYCGSVVTVGYTTTTTRTTSVSVTISTTVQTSFSVTTVPSSTQTIITTVLTTTTQTPLPTTSLV